MRRAQKEDTNVVDDELTRTIIGMRHRAYDEYLGIVSDMYFGSLGESPDEVINSLRDISAEPGKLEGPIGGVLTSPYRNTEILDNWTLKDIALFVAAITRFGRDWAMVGDVLPHKSHRDFVDFYFGVWKCSKMYKNWKKTRKQKGLC